MAKTAQEFLDQLASSGLIPPEVLDSLRRQVAKASKPVSSGTVARTLVDHGHLTEAQGERLTGGPLPASRKSTSHSGVLGLEPIGEPAAKAVKSPAPAKPQADIDRAAAELGLAPLHEEPKPTSPSASGTKLVAKAAPTAPAKPKEKTVSAIDGLMPLEGLTPITPASKPVTPKASPSTISKVKPAGGTPSTIAKAKAPTPSAASIEGLAPLSPLPGDDLFGSTSGLDPLGSSAVIPLNSPVNLADPLADPLAAASPLAAPTPAAAKPAAVPKKRSKVLPVIAVVVILLLVVGGVAGFVLTRSNGDQEFALAEQDYQAKSYSAAIEKHSTFLEDFPANPKVGTARLHRGMAKILGAAPTKDNYATVLPVAKAALTEIGGEKDLSQLHAELAPLLTDMAAGLAEQAKQGKSAAESAEKLALAKDALALANDGRFVPGSLRQWQRLAEVEESLALLERDLARGNALEAALAGIKKSAQGGKLDAALAERSKVLLTYPELAGEAGLKDLGKQISKAVASAVKTSADSSKGESAEPKTGVLGSLSLSSGKPGAASETPEQTFFGLAAGTVWALDGGSGKLLWSRAVGRHGGQAVTPISADTGSDVVFADLLRNEVACMNPRTGQLRWRHPFKEPLAGEPLVLGDQVFVATNGGKVVALDAKSGSGKVAAQLPQGINLGPSAGDGKILVVADQSFLYVLSPDLKCEGAVYLGHEPGSVQTPPIVLSGHAVVAELRGTNSLLHVVGLDEKGLAAGTMQQVEVPGLVSTPPVRLGERLLVLSDQQTVAFDYKPGDDEPLKKLGETENADSLPLVRFGAVLADKLWIGDDGLHRFDFLPAGGTVKESWNGFAGQTLESPPQSAGDTVFCIRRGAGQSGFIATALKGASGEAIWETHLAEPLVSLGQGSDASLMATMNTGEEVKVDVALLNGCGVQFVPAKPEGATPEATVAQAATPLAWAGGVLKITTSGSVELVDEKSAPLAEPFQLSIRPGVALANCSAAAAGENVVISDGGDAVYLLRLEKTPQPRLELLTKATLKTPALSRIAASESAALIVDTSGTVQVLTLPELKAKAGAKLDCRSVISGPEAVGKNVLLELDTGELVCLDAAGKQVWKMPLPDGLAGRPLAVASDFLLPTRGGTILRVAAASGKEVAKGSLGQPLAGSPVLLGGAVFVPTAAGGILKVAIPEKK